MSDRSNAHTGDIGGEHGHRTRVRGPAVAGYVVLGVLQGASADGDVLLARAHDGRLIALRKDVGAMTHDAHSVMFALDASIVDAPRRCAACDEPVNNDTRFCGRCGGEITPEAVDPARPHSPTELRRAVREEAPGFEILGEVDLGTDEGIVYLARRAGTAVIVGLWLAPDDAEDGYSLVVLPSSALLVLLARFGDADVREHPPGDGGEPPVASFTGSDLVAVVSSRLSRDDAPGTSRPFGAARAHARAVKRWSTSVAVRLPLAAMLVVLIGAAAVMADARDARSNGDATALDGHAQPASPDRSITSAAESTESRLLPVVVNAPRTQPAGPVRRSETQAPKPRVAATRSHTTHDGGARRIAAPSTRSSPPVADDQDRVVIPDIDLPTVTVDAPAPRGGVTGSRCTARYVARVWADAMAECTREAKRGSPEAQLHLGTMYAHGYGVARAPDIAAHWLTLAADRQHGAAEYLLSTLYEGGRGVALDQARATELLQRAAAHGHAPAQRALAVDHLYGLGVDRSRVDALRWFRLAAAQGDREAQYRAATLLSGGMANDAAEHAEAVRWYTRAAEQGDERAQRVLTARGLAW